MVHRLGRLIGLCVVCVLAILAKGTLAATVFDDNFDRRDGPVGNGWVVVQENIDGGQPTIIDKRLTGAYRQSTGFYSYGHMPTIKRDISLGSAVYFSVDLTPDTSNRTSYQHHAVIGLGFDESQQYPSFSGLQVRIVDGGGASSVDFYQNGIGGATVYSPFRFGDLIRVSVRFDLSTKEIVGTVLSGVNTLPFRFAFLPSTPILQNVYFSLGPGLYTPVTTGQYATADNIRVSYGDAGAGRIVYVGVCGVGAIIQEPCIGGNGWYDPRESSLLASFDPLDDAQLSTVAHFFSGIDAVALRVAKRNPSSITYIRGFNLVEFLGGNLAKAKVIAEFVKSVYVKGDRVVLVGHSGGGAVVQEAAYSLESAKIPVEMTAQIDSIGTGPDAKVASTVRRAFNFYFPWSFSYDRCTTWGETQITPKLKGNPTGTIVSNVAIDSPKPTGPTASNERCAGHKNMDNDPRVWRPILDYLGG